MDTAKKKEKLLKVLVIGDVGTGKTSFIRRYISQKFHINYKATIGSDFAIKAIEWDENCTIKLQLWDIAEQMVMNTIEYGTFCYNTVEVKNRELELSCNLMFTKVYYRDAVGAFVAFDVARAATFEAVEKWKHDLDDKLFLPSGLPIPAILLANKCDQKCIVEKGKIEKLCDDLGFMCYMETSAKENIGIDDAIKLLISNVLRKEELGKELTSRSHHVQLSDKPQPEKNCCACLKPKLIATTSDGQQNKLHKDQ